MLQIVEESRRLASIMPGGELKNVSLSSFLFVILFRHNHYLCNTSLSTLTCLLYYHSTANICDQPRDCGNVVFPVVNEVCRVIEEGVFVRASYLDVASVHGMKFPSERYMTTRALHQFLRL